MTEQEYKKLNDYLNRIYIDLGKNDSFLLNNLFVIAIMSTNYLNFVDQYSFNDEIKTGNLNIFEIYDLSRKVIENISEKYLKLYDSIIDTGILTANYDNLDSEEIKMIDNSMFSNFNKEIYIDTKFNYDDVDSLVHEFFHFLNFNNTINRYLLTEAISIYFGMYSYDILCEMGINKNQIMPQYRILNTRHNARFINKYNKFLIAFDKFGNIDDDTYELLNKHICQISKEDYESDLKDLLSVFSKIEKQYNNQEYDKLTRELAHPFTIHYRYFLGTLLSVYARKYSTKDDIVKLNDLIASEDSALYDFPDLLRKIGIDIFDSEFINKTMIGLKEYMVNILESSNKIYKIEKKFNKYK